MNRDEKITWQLFLFVLGGFLLFLFGGVLGAISASTSHWLIPASIAGVSFGVIFIIWLFRVTFLAGRRYR